MVYDVIVGNIGSVCRSGCTKEEALKIYREYVDQSKKGYGRAAGESVAYFEGNELVKEFIGKEEL